MSTSNKLRPSESELTKLKVLWRDSLSEEAKEFWRSLFVSAESTQAEIRQQIASKLKINLRHDSQLNAFRDWELEQRELDLEAERQEEDERRALAENPEWTLDQARDVVLTKAYKRASARGDFKLGLMTVDRDIAAKKVSLDSRKLVLLEKKAAAYDRAQAALAEAKSSKGGITPETLKKIETELKLL